MVSGFDVFRMYKIQQNSFIFVLTSVSQQSLNLIAHLGN